MQKDRRIFDRFKVDFPAEIKEVASQVSSHARCCDISAAGAGMFTDQKLIPQTNSEIWLGIPNGHKPFRSLAEVVWTKQVQEDRWRSGLKFNTVSFMAIGRFLEPLLRQKDDSR